MDESITSSHASNGDSRRGRRSSSSRHDSPRRGSSRRDSSGSVTSSNRDQRSGSESIGSRVASRAGGRETHETQELAEGSSCRALYSAPNYNHEFICHGTEKCRKHGHKALRAGPEEGRGLPGIYDAFHSNRGAFVGFLSHTYRNADMFHQEAEERRLRNLDDARGLEFLQPVAPAPHVTDVAPVVPVVATPPVAVGRVFATGTSSVSSTPAEVPFVDITAVPTATVPGPRVPEIPATPIAGAVSNELLAQLTAAVVGLQQQQTDLQRMVLAQSANPLVVAQDVTDPVIPQRTAALPPVPGERAAAPPSILRGSELHQRENPPFRAPTSTVQAANDDLLHHLTTTNHELAATVPYARPTPTAVSLLPQGSMLGKDPSIGEKDKVYGIRLTDATGLAKGLAPAQFSQKGSQRYCEGLVDVAAFPRGEGTYDNAAGSMLIEALSALVSTKNAGLGGQVDTGFTNAQRNGLSKITTLEKLQTLASTITEESEDLVSAMAGRLGDTVIVLLSASSEEAAMLVQCSPLYRLGTRTVELYLLLLNHLLGLNYKAGSNGWAICEQSLKYHASKLARIRQTYSVRIQILAANYAYLRDCLSSDFRPQRLLSMQVDALQASLSRGGSDAFGGTTGICRHCNTGLHGTTLCPWRSKTTVQAKKLGAAALVNLATTPAATDINAAGVSG